jgi:hypothetical protein
MPFNRYIMTMFGKGYQLLSNSEHSEYTTETSLKSLSRSRNVYRNLAVIQSCSRSRLVYCKRCYQEVKRGANGDTVPSDGHVTYEKRRLWRDIENNVYAGSPRKEHDDAWKRLIERERSRTLRFIIARF